MSDAAARSQRVAAWFGAGVAVLIIAQQVAAKTTRDALFLSRFPASYLPYVIAGSAVLAIIAAVLVSRFIARRTPARASPTLFLGNGIMLAGAWPLASLAPDAAAVLIYLQTAALGAALVSSFWSVVNERFDPHTAKNMMGRIGAGATAGGVVGGIVAWQVSALLGVPALLATLAGLNLTIALALIRLRAPVAGAKRADPEPSRASGLTILRNTPYLRLLAYLIALAALAETMLDYVFKAAAAAQYSDAVDLAAFFAIFHTVVSVVTLAVQGALAGRVLRRFGLASTAATYPSIMVAGCVAAFASPLMFLITAVRGAASAVENSLFRSAYELTYTPIAPRIKRPTKAIIDVMSDKLAAIFGGGVILVIVTAVPESSTRTLLGLTIAVAAVALALAPTLHRQYVASLADGLRSGLVELDDEAIRDATTRITFADTRSINRQQVLDGIAELRAAGKFGGTASHEPARASKAVHHDDASVAALSPDEIEMAIEALSDDANLTATVRRLRDAHNAVPALLEALLDPARPLTVRRRIPRVLSETATQPVADALLVSLTDDALEVRYRAAVALLQITLSNPAITIPKQDVFAAAFVELSRREPVQPIDRPGGEPLSPFDDPALVKQVGPSIGYVFTVLALVLDREPLHLAFCALATDDVTLRGQGIEYLDSVLPTHLRQLMIPFFTDQPRRLRVRPREQIAAELLESRDTLSIDRRKLLELIRTPN